MKKPAVEPDPRQLDWIEELRHEYIEQDDDRDDDDSGEIALPRGQVLVAPIERQRGDIAAQNHPAVSEPEHESYPPEFEGEWIGEPPRASSLRVALRIAGLLGGFAAAPTAGELTVLGRIREQGNDLALGVAGEAAGDARDNELRFRVRRGESEEASDMPRDRAQAHRRARAALGGDGVALTAQPFGMPSAGAVPTSSVEGSAGTVDAFEIGAEDEDGVRRLHGVVDAQHFGGVGSEISHSLGAQLDCPTCGVMFGDAEPRCRRAKGSDLCMDCAIWYDGP